MNSCALIIATCRHILPNGRRCQQPAVRRRACCRHHLDAQSRLHNMARARRRTLVLRLRVPETLRDLAWNKTEVNRVLATERLDPDTALKILWAMDLSAIALRAESACRPRRAQNCAPNLNGFYDVSATPLFPGNLSEILSQVTQNTWDRGRRHTSDPAGYGRLEKVDGEERRARGIPHLRGDSRPPSIIKASLIPRNALWHSTRKSTNSAKKS